MNKKIMIVGILTVFMLVAISFSSVTASNKPTAVEKKKSMSPLFGIRTKSAIGEKLSNLKAKFLEDRVFLAFSLLKLFKKDPQGWTDTWPLPTACAPTCLKCVLP